MNSSLKGKDKIKLVKALQARKRRKREEVRLSKASARLILEMLYGGREQNTKFLYHDDWDQGLTRKERHRGLKPDRKFVLAIQKLKKALL